MKKMNLEKIRIMQGFSGLVTNRLHLGASVDVIKFADEVPESLIAKWKAFDEAKRMLNIELEAAGIALIP